MIVLFIYVCKNRFFFRALGRSIIMYLFVTLLFSLYPFANCYAGVDLNSNQQQQPLTPFTNNQLRLAIPDFKMVAGENRYLVLERALPELVAVGLIENSMVKYVDRPSFWENAIKRMQISEIQKNTDLIYKEEFLDALKIDLILRGNFFEYSGKIRFEASLQNRKNGKTVNISSGVVDVRTVYTGISQLAMELDAEIRTMIRATMGKKVAILCFTDHSEIPSDQYQTLGRNLAISLISSLDLEEKASVLPWSVTKNYCEVDNAFDQALLDIAEADAFLEGSYIIDENDITILPILHIKDTADIIDLISVKGHLNKYLQVENNLVDDVSNILEAIIDQDGTWNIKPLLFSDDPEQYLKNGKKHLNQDGNIYLAALMFSRAIKINRSNSQAHFYLGYVRQIQGRYQEAINEFKEAIKINENYAEAYRRLGKVYLEQDNSRLALQEFNKAAKIDPALTDIHFDLAKVHYLLGDYEATLQEAQEALKRDLNNTEIYGLLARAHLSLGSVDKAIESYITAKKIDPDNPTIRSSLLNLYIEQGRLFFRSQKYTEALKFFEKAKALQPSETTYGWLMLVLNNMERYDESLKIFDEANKNKMVDPYLYNSKGFVLETLKRYDAAIDAYNQAIELDKDYASSYYNKGVTYSEMGKHGNAIDNLSKFINLQPKNIHGYNERGNVYRKLGEYDKALNDFNNAIRLDPQFGAAYHNRGALYTDWGEYDAAINDFNKAIEFGTPDIAASYDGLALVYTKIGKYDIALAYLTKSIDTDPTDPLSLLSRVELYILMNNFNEALNDIATSSTLLTNSEEPYYEVISYYLECVSKKLLHLDTSHCETEINRLVKEDITIPWSFEEIESWAKSARISEDEKRYVLNLVETLKSRGQ